jgi:hypothetical protein
MTTHGSRFRFVLALAGLLAFVAILGADDESAPPAAPEQERLRVHVDPARVEQAMFDAARAFYLERPAAARSALDRVEAGMRRLEFDDRETLGKDLQVYDRAFHKTLDLAREYAARGLQDDAFNQFVWVQRGCYTCHRIAREQGLLNDAENGSVPGADGN